MSRSSKSSALSRWRASWYSLYSFWNRATARRRNALVDLTTQDEKVVVAVLRDVFVGRHILRFRFADDLRVLSQRSELQRSTHIHDEVWLRHLTAGSRKILLLLLNESLDKGLAVRG